LNFFFFFEILKKNPKMKERKKSKELKNFEEIE